MGHFAIPSLTDLQVGRSFPAMRRSSKLHGALLLLLAVGIVTPRGWIVLCTTANGDRHIEVAHEADVHHHDRSGNEIHTHQADHGVGRDCDVPETVVHDCPPQASEGHCDDLCDDSALSARFAQPSTRHTLPPPLLLLLQVLTFPEPLVQRIALAPSAESVSSTAPLSRVIESTVLLI